MEVYKALVRPAMIYGLKMVVLTKRQEVAELKILIGSDPEGQG